MAQTKIRQQETLAVPKNLAALLGRKAKERFFGKGIGTPDQPFSPHLHWLQRMEE